MKLVLVQPDILWESPGENLENLNKLLDQIEGKPDLIILPEMFTTGFSMNTKEMAQPPENPVIGWMRGKATRFKSAIMGSMIIADHKKENSRNDGDDISYFNRLIFLSEEGDLFFYDKRHMFRMGGEGDHFSAGKKRLIVNHMAWKICPLICYDLRFPVWSRNREDYDLLIYVANWPAVRSDVWNTLLKARAIENQSWVVGVNRTGKDGEGINYIGESQIVNPKGEVVDKLNGREMIREVDISLEELDIFRQKFPVWKDRDHFAADW
ncbi:MAG: amidohydrolase [Bacteroidota bacterium]